MRALPILAAILCTAPLAKGAASQMDLLQSRCQEYERQIRQLEEENSRLKSLVNTASKTPATQEAPVAKKEDAKAVVTPAAQTKAPEKESTDAYGIVRDGDTLVKLAKRHGTTPEAIAKLNDLKKPYPIRAGQRLRLPEKTEAVASTKSEKSEVAAVAEASTKPAAPSRSKHTVKDGETFYSIARHYRIGAEALQSANPGVKATALHTGQVINIEKPADTPAPVAKSSSSKPAASTPKTAASKPAAESPKAPAPAPKPAAEKSSETAAKTSEAPKHAAAETAAKTPVASETPAPSPAPAPASNGPRIHTIAIEENTDLADFAAAHGTSIAKLNALNGLNLNSSTVLAKGSELYVPAQP
ncbi:LysM peptidoglycan-binding domain-containing protein [Haloferula sp. BvORR071]|uniref:LysM peptidoglycan-binding domain-containing protein n=1 Tax=Haloferula sp. BvORR071 TaxID=1396141 RepID=UPI002240EF5E|nr:LysM peptidoglycan-binding domain-containing protein [Haloferula sp. BvORR071]